MYSSINLKMKVSLIIFVVLVLLVGIGLFFNAITLAQLPSIVGNSQVVVNSGVNLQPLIIDYAAGGTVFSIIGAILIFLGIRF